MVCDKSEKTLQTNYQKGKTAKVNILGFSKLKNQVFPRGYREVTERLAKGSPNHIVSVEKYFTTSLLKNYYFQPVPKMPDRLAVATLGITDKQESSPPVAQDRT